MTEEQRESIKHEEEKRKRIGIVGDTDSDWLDLMNRAANGEKLEVRHG